MAKISHCGHWMRATVYRIKSAYPAYIYQRVYVVAQCKGQCKKRLWYWCGEYPNGTLTDPYEIPPEKRAEWKRRFTIDKPRPKIQMTSEYTNRIKGPIDKQIQYQRRIRWAQSLKPIQPE